MMFTEDDRDDGRDDVLKMEIEESKINYRAESVTNFSMKLFDTRQSNFILFG